MTIAQVLSSDLLDFLARCDLVRHLSDLPIGHEVEIWRDDELLATHYTTEYGQLRIWQTAVVFYRGRGAFHNWRIVARNSGTNSNLRCWSSWEGHTI